VEINTTQEGGERVIRFQTPAGTISARWTLLGTNGDWWQMEYPVKTKEDLAAAVELAKARSYALNPGQIAEREPMVGEDGVLAIEIPRRPYSDVLHEFLGWSEGLLLLGEPEVEEIIAILESKLQELVQAMAELPGQVVLSPDNLDGQFLPPSMFRQHLADSYRHTAETLHQQNKYLLVHVGGPIKGLLAALAEAGVDGVEGIAGPPQGDLKLSQAREIAGADLTLWGGIPQDLLLDAHSKDEFETVVAQAVREAKGDSRMILGVADRVPVEAVPGRLEAIPALVERLMQEI
jgi:hypothetical protein